MPSVIRGSVSTSPSMAPWFCWKIDASAATLAMSVGRVPP
jgi:hypothetical protein